MLKAENLNNKEKLYLIEDFDKVLSLDLLKEDEEVKDAVDAEFVAYIEEMIQKRQEAKKNKDYVLADKIRAELLEKGIMLEDTRQGVNWKKIN
jgi:cysteinyl-tRNA synthetase